MELELTLPVPTSINALYVNQFRFNPVTRKREPTGGRILSKKGEACKKEIQTKAKKQLKDQDWKYEWTADKDNYIYQDAVIYFSRRGRDDNNIYKLLNDSLEKVIYENDSRVLVRTQKILYDKENPRIELKLSPVEYVGIFENKDEAQDFEQNCKLCTRYLEGRCSILVDSKAGTVREEINSENEVQCRKFKQKKNKK